MGADSGSSGVVSSRFKRLIPARGLDFLPVSVYDALLVWTSEVTNLAAELIYFGECLWLSE